MAVNTMPQKRFKYIIENGVTQTELDIDPKGWDGHEVGFERSDDFGINIQNIVPLSFSGAGRNILKGVYENNGIFGQTRTLIEKRQNDWTYALFYAYKHDYSTYKDNLHYIEIAGLEDGLAKKFDTYKDTEYEIDLPTSNKVFIDYTGAKYTTTNQIQAGAGSIQDFQKPDIVTGDDAYALRGSRAVRAYNNKVAFTDSEGLPYETMTFRALQSVQISLTLYRNITIEADAAILQSTPASGRLKLIQHDTSFANPTQVVKSGTSTQINYAAASSSTPANNRIDIFEGNETFNIDIVAGKLYTVFYIADEKSYDGINVLEAANCYIDISNVVDSAYQNAKLEAFTYEWLIEQLLLKIDSNAVFASTVTYPNVKELISCTPCIKNMGSTTGTGKIKTTLKDVLESFNKLKCIAIDITGNNFTISNRSAVYPTGSSYGLITVNNIVVEHSTEHQYNKITVGADTDDRQDDDPLVYPFICEKEFSVENTLAENELDLVNNFMLDPYAIDKYIIDTLGTTDVKDECKFVVFATIPIMSTSEYAGYGEKTDSFINSGSQPIVVGHSCTYLIPNEDVKYDSKLSLTCNAIYNNQLTPYLYSIEIRINNEQEPIEVFEGNGKPNGITFQMTNQILANNDIFVFYNQQYELIENSSDSVSFISSSSDFIYATAKEIGKDLYRGHDKPITGFSGDSDTIYNIPLTPKRILDRWKQYLAISVVGATTKKLTYGTATILNSAITSKCDYEAASVVENSDLSLTGVTPLFLPTTISADTSETILDIKTFEDNDKYKYFSLKDEKTNKTYQGWINSVTFALAKNKSKQIMLQAKQI